jgi:hypothetical protein
VYVVSGTVTLSGTTLNGNVAQGGNGGSGSGLSRGGSGLGGGLYVGGGTVTLTGDTLQSNKAHAGTGAPPFLGQGGGIYIIPAETGVSIDAATVAQVTGNTASSGAAFDDIVGPYTLT